MNHCDEREQHARRVPRDRSRVPRPSRCPYCSPGCHAACALPGRVPALCPRRARQQIGRDRAQRPETAAHRTMAPVRGRRSPGLRRMGLGLLPGRRCRRDGRVAGAWPGGREQAGGRASERERSADPECRAVPGAERLGGGVRSVPGEHGDGERDSERAAELAHHGEGAGRLADVLGGDERAARCGVNWPAAAPVSQPHRRTPRPNGRSWHGWPARTRPATWAASSDC